MPTEPGLVRGSGARRHRGALYLEVSHDSLPMPYASYILDPPYPLTTAPTGGDRVHQPMLVPDARGTWHVVDYLSEAHYPFATDFLEEGRKKGISRLVPRSIDLRRLTPRVSTVLFMHSRGYLDNWYEFQDADVEGQNDSRCLAVALASEFNGHPRVIDHFGPGCVLHCCRHLWSAAHATIIATATGTNIRFEIRKFTDIGYRISPATRHGIRIEPSWRWGCIARFPITGFTAVRSTSVIPGASQHDNLLRSRYPVHLGAA